MSSKFCTSVIKELKLKARKFWGLATIVEITGKKQKLLEGPILNRVKIFESVDHQIVFLALVNLQKAIFDSF